MHQPVSYLHQFTPYLANHCVDGDAIISADRMALAIDYYAEMDDFEKWEHYNEVLQCSLYTNGVLGLCMKKSLEAYLRGDNGQG